jgi:hypothetical protein
LTEQERGVKPETLETRILKRIERKRGDVSLRAELGNST